MKSSKALTSRRDWCVHGQIALVEPNWRLIARTPPGHINSLPTSACVRRPFTTRALNQALGTGCVGRSRETACIPSWVIMDQIFQCIALAPPLSPVRISRISHGEYHRSPRLPNDVMINIAVALAVSLFFFAPGPRAAYRAGLVGSLAGVQKVWSLAATMVSFGQYRGTSSLGKYVVKLHCKA